VLEINLNKPKSYSTSVNNIKPEGITFKSKSGSSSQGDVALLFKFLLILLPGLGLFQYSKYINGVQSSSQAQSLHKKVDSLKLIETNLDANIKKNQDLKVQFDEMNLKLNWMNDAGARRIQILKAIETIQETLPENLWLSSLSARSSEIIIDGYSLKEKDLGSFLSLLEQQGLFKDVILQRSVPTDLSGKKIIQYNLKINIAEG